MDKLLYSIPETCELLNMSRSYLYQLISIGRLRPIKLGRKTLFAAETLRDFVKKELEKANG